MAIAPPIPRTRTGTLLFVVVMDELTRLVTDLRSRYPKRWTE